MRKKFLNLATALGLTAGLFVGAIGSAGAAPEDPGQSSIYFPWVPYESTLAGVEGVNGAVTVQNVENVPVNVTVEGVSTGEGVTLRLNPNASQTFTAAALGLADGGEGVVATAEWAVDQAALIAAGICTEVVAEEVATMTLAADIVADDVITVAAPYAIAVGEVSQTDDNGDVTDFVESRDYDLDLLNAGTANAQIVLTWLNEVDSEYPVAGELDVAYTAATDFSSVTLTRGGGELDTFEVPADAAEPFTITSIKAVDSDNVYTDFEYEVVNGIVTIDWSGASEVPSQNALYVVTYASNELDCDEPRIAGVVKTNVDGEMVDGYTALPEADAATKLILPIVQTNDGWNTEFVITNVSENNTSVNATFYAAEGQGIGGPSDTLLSAVVLAPGESVAFDLAENGIDEGTVGSVWIDSTFEVTAVAFRAKTATNMMLTNVAQPRAEDESANVKYAPLVFRDYNGWNTGINIANLGSASNQVTITLYNYSGNVVATESVNIPPRGMEYVYMPATGELGLGDQQISSAKIVGSGPLAAAVDEVKYLGGLGEGHAMSYLATTTSDATLALPLLQKGNARTGLGDTSGINLYNPNSTFGADVSVTFYDSAGVPVAPTVSSTDAPAPMTFDLPAGAGATLYTLSFSEMPEGLRGSAVITTDVGLVGVSNNVNYDVNGDGSAVFSLSNVD